MQTAASEKDYAAWRLPHVRWPSAAAFLESESLADGVHTIATESGVEIDLYMRGGPLASTDERSLLVFLAGAVSGRESKRGPFFSGLGIAGGLDMPVIALADPGVDIDPRVNLAWYTGSPGQRVQEAITDLLRGIAVRAARDLLLVGGSGGGFAALHFGAQLGDLASVFVWNPQTDVLRYSPGPVKRYLRHAYGYANTFLATETWQQDVRRRVGREVTLDVLRPETALRPRRLFYLQNATDWHVQSHLVPLLSVLGVDPSHPLSGRIRLGPNHVVQLSHASDGHAPPPSSLLADVLDVLATTSATAEDAAAKSLSHVPLKRTM